MQSKTFDTDNSVIENEVIRVMFSANNGLIERAFNKLTGESIVIEQDVSHM